VASAAGVLLALAGPVGVGAPTAELPRPSLNPPVPAPARTGPPTLDDWFEGGAAGFRLQTRLTAATMPSADVQFGNGAHITVAPDDPGTWYVFGRQVAPQPSPPCDTLGIAVGVKVWKSPDRGTTWSEPETVVAPAEGTPWACFAGDGDAYYDGVTATWHYLAQCRGRDNLWNGCHWTRSGPDPMGPWQPDPANPVVSAAPGAPNNLWQRICGPATNCFADSGGTVADAGTFSIFDVPSDPGYHYVRFHGTASANSHQYTGLAKTPDFVHWLVGADDPAHLPPDDIFDSRFPTGFPATGPWPGTPAWQEPHWLPPNPVPSVIGGGGGDVVHEAPWYYLVTEASDRPLCGMAGATWDLGVYRTDDLRSTVWASPSSPHENPVAVSDEGVAGSPAPTDCNPAYARLFRDPATHEVHLVYTRAVRQPGGPDAPLDPARSGLFVYTLRWNLLDGGGPASATGWTVVAATANSPAHLVARRDSFRAADGNGYVLFNCGKGDADPSVACGAAKAIYRDVPIGRDPPPRVSFGAQAASLDGRKGRVTVVVGQLDAGGRWLKTDAVPADVEGAGYTSVASPPVDLVPGAARLRFVVWANGLAFPVQVDEPYIEPAS
jgi:hypothetical protein